MAIETFEDIQTKIGLPKETLDAIAGRMKAATGGEFSFTDLQKEAFNKTGYWVSDNETSFPRHIVVQGATSSGKTLVSELSVIECLRNNKKAVILVPLKAMVRERKERFAHDLKNERVYASSSDFQDHDTEIIRGEYDVAVIVYEKFFAMLSQPSAQILKECALLVIDELQMLSSEGRGPKLEISIQKVMRQNAELGTDNIQGTYTRIMCLTTCDCKIDYIKSWLSVDGTEPLEIISDKRPMGLEEYIYTVDGVLEGKYTKGERDEKEIEEAFKEFPEPIKIENYNKNNRSDVAKKLALIPLLKRIYEHNPNAKVLVFVSDRQNTRNLAEKIVQEGVLPRTTGTQELLSELQNYDNDEGQEYLKQLLPYGIAIHNSALSTALREFIEKGFEQAIKLVVATETLTIGMNMPVDVMIVYDTKVPRGKEIREELTSQEYKNFIGRAGRLGQSNTVGQSYIFALNKNEAAKYRDMYVNCRMQDIKSSLLFAKEDIQAPYYLSLLTPGKNYRMSSLHELRDVSFSAKCGGRKIDMSLVMQELKKASLCNLKKTSDWENDDDLIDNNQDDEPEWSLSELGKLLSPYAFHMSTCKKIRRYFLNGGYRKYQNGKFEESLEKGAGGIPEGITADDIKSDRYLLDILFLLCSTQEVRDLGQLRLPNGDNLRQAKDIIWEKLEEMTKADNDGKVICELWPESKLRWILDGNSNHENEDLQIVMRTILLWHWTKGYTITEIRNKTKFKQFLHIYSGDLARLAEVVSYELDAIYRCTDYFSRTFKIKYDQRGPAEIYVLSTRVSYGMPRSLVIIANCHVYGMDRSVVLKIGKKAKEANYDTPLKFLLQATKEELEGIISETLRNEILSMRDRNYYRDNFRSLLDTIQKNQAVILSHEEINALIQLYELKSSDENRVYEVLHMMFREAGEDKNQSVRFFDETSVFLMGNNNTTSLFEISMGEKIKLTVVDYDNGVLVSSINDYFKVGTLNILLVKNSNILNQLHWNNEKGKYDLVDEKGICIIENIDVAMSCQNFAVLLAQTIALDDKKCHLLSALLNDLSGAFTPRGNKAIYCLLKNYQPERRYSLVDSWPLRVVCDYQCGNDDENVEKLFAELESHGIKFRAISWGEELKKERGDEYTVLYISKASLCTKSMNEYFERIQQKGFRNVRAVFDDESDYLQLSGDARFPFEGLTHYSGRNLLTKVNYIQRFEEEKKRNQGKAKIYYIGVSYSHTFENGVERPAVMALKKIVCGLNAILGEENILFDQNPSFKDKFDGNNALTETLELYRQCRNYVILDDHHYMDGDNCPREANVIMEKLNSSSNEYSQRVWFLRPKNDTGSCLFNKETDYKTTMDYTDENIKSIIDLIAGAIIN